MKQYHLMEDSPQILFRRHRSLALDVSTEQGEFRFFCEFLAPSFSRFSKARAFHHPDPAFSRLFLIEKGSAEISMDHRRFPLKEGDIALLPAEHPFHADYHRGLVCKAFHLHLHDELGFTIGKEVDGVQSVHRPPLTEALLSLIRSGPECAVHSQVASVVLLLLEPFFSTAAERLALPPFYRKLMTEMSELPPARLRLETLARKHCISRSALGKGFRRAFGCSFKQYQQNLLLMKARKLLMDDSLSISQIAGELGFRQILYFFEFFRRASGITPMEVRKQRPEGREDLL